MNKLAFAIAIAIAIATLSFSSGARAGVPVGNGGNDAAYDFFQRARAALTRARLQPALAALPYDRLERILDETRVTVAAEPLFVGEGEWRQRVTAKNFREPYAVILDGERWPGIASTDRREALSFHELLCMAGLEGTADYRYSQHYRGSGERDAAAPANDFAALEALNDAPDAAVTIVVYSDFQDPFYATHGARIMGELMREFGRDLQVRIHNFPLRSLHEHADGAARAGICAAAQGKFREFHDRLVPLWDQLGPETYVREAAAIGGIDGERLRACLDSPAVAARVDLEYGQAVGMHFTGAPTFLISSNFETVRLGGVYPVETFRRIVQRLLRREAPGSGSRVDP